jgi:hypothetical protein
MTYSRSRFTYCPKRDVLIKQANDRLENHNVLMKASLSLRMLTNLRLADLRLTFA